MATAYCNAVGSEYRRADFICNRLNRGASGLVFDELAEGERIKVEVIPLDAYTNTFEELALSFIKIDCEGSELDVLRGARKIIQHYRPSLFIETNEAAFKTRGTTLEELLGELTDYRYEFFPSHWIKAGHHPHDVLAIAR